MDAPIKSEHDGNEIVVPLPEAEGRLRPPQRVATAKAVSPLLYAKGLIPRPLGR